MTDTPTTQQTEQTVTALLSQLAQITAQQEKLKQASDAIKANLHVLHELGQIDSRLEHAGWQFQWSAGRQTYDYPTDIVELEAQLMAARETAVATGRAIAKPLAPFWTVRKPSKRSKGGAA
jgi:hypothetical protein